MIESALFVLLALAVGVPEGQTDEATGPKASGRVVEGAITATGGKPVKGATVLFGEVGSPAKTTATTDADGRYRADFVNLRGSVGTLQALVLAPGFKALDRKVKPGTGTAIVNFELVGEPWRETEVRLEGSTGRPIADEEIRCSVRDLVFARYRTDALGRCRIRMANNVWMVVSAKPKDARPIKAHFNGGKDDPISVSLPVLPAIRGRVIDTEGRPVPDAAVGRWLTFDTDGTGEMLRFFDGAVALTDRAGSFVIAPTLQMSFGSSRPAPTIGILCFAAPSYRSDGWLLFHSHRPIRMAVQLFEPNRPVEPMIITLKPSRLVRIPISREFATSKRNTQYSSQMTVALRKDIPHYEYVLISRALKPTKESSTQTSETILEEYLPEGTYQLAVTLEDEKSSEALGRARREITVPRGDSPLVLPQLKLEPTDNHKLVGKRAPEIDAIELNTGRPVKLANFRGRVVLLDFWGYWCGPCTWNMPHLVELNHKFAGRPLTILAIHDQSVQSRATYDRRIATVRERVWDGRDLPFRVLLDRPDTNDLDGLTGQGNGSTIKRYSVTGFPSLFLIDRDGTVIGQIDPFNHDRLDSLIRDLVAKAEQVH